MDMKRFSAMHKLGRTSVELIPGEEPSDENPVGTATEVRLGVAGYDPVTGDEVWSNDYVTPEALREQLVALTEQCKTLAAVLKQLG